MRAIPMSTPLPVTSVERAIFVGKKRVCGGLSDYMWLQQGGRSGSRVAGMQGKCFQRRPRSPGRATDARQVPLLRLELESVLCHPEPQAKRKSQSWVECESRGAGDTTYAAEAKLVGDAAAPSAGNLAPVHDHARDRLRSCGPEQGQSRSGQKERERERETDVGGHGVEFVHGGGAGPEVELGVVADVLVRVPEQLVVCGSRVESQWVGPFLRGEAERGSGPATDLRMRASRRVAHVGSARGILASRRSLRRVRNQAMERQPEPGEISREGTRIARSQPLEIIL